MKQDHLSSFVEQMFSTVQIAEVEENELLPHVLLAFDPELCEPGSPWLGCGNSVIGPYPDLHAALAAASQWEAGLNKGSSPDDDPFRVLVLAIHPPIDDDTIQRPS